LPSGPQQRPCPTRSPETIFGLEAGQLTSEQLERGLDGAEVARLREAYAALGVGEHARLEELSLEEAATYVLDTVVSRQVPVAGGTNSDAVIVYLSSQGATSVSKGLIWNVAALATAVSRGATLTWLTALAEQVEIEVGRLQVRGSTGPLALTGVMMRAVLPNEISH